MDESIYAFAVIAIIINIVLLIVFLVMAKNVGSINKKLDKVSKMYNAVEFIKQRFDGKMNYLTEERSVSEIKFLITNGYKDEAKRMLLRKVWILRSELSYEELYKRYNPYFEKINLPFPDKSLFGKVSNPV